jgi:hypothetical protein
VLVGADAERFFAPPDPGGRLWVGIRLQDRPDRREIAAREPARCGTMPRSRPPVGRLSEDDEAAGHWRLAPLRAIETATSTHMSANTHGSPHPCGDGSGR